MSANMDDTTVTYVTQSAKRKKGLLGVGIFIVVLLVLLGFVVWHGMKNAATSQMQEKKVRISPVFVQTVYPTDVTEKFKINGNIMAENSVNILPDIGGKLIRYTVNVGDKVQRGQVVAYIDPSKPGTTFKLNPVTAPFAGVISSLPIELGNTVAPTTAVAQLGDLSRLKIETYIPERFVDAIHLGKEATVSVAAFPGEVFKARVYELAPTLDKTTRTLLVKLRVIKGEKRLLSGMFATLVIDTHTTEDVLTVASEAIVRRSGKPYVFVVTGEKGTTSSNQVTHNDPGAYDGKAKMVSVETGLETEGKVIITKGLNTGDRVIYSGQELLQDDALVCIIPADDDVPEESNLATHTQEQ